MVWVIQTVGMWGKESVWGGRGRGMLLLVGKAVGRLTHLLTWSAFGAVEAVRQFIEASNAQFKSIVPDCYTLRHSSYSFSESEHAHIW